ncbi:hypothetical protein NHQ30_008135 [Ciborinia camelliae]|nr:hypothetical protein NHQ30_008135 [Ciborinia camelliae]
MAGLEVIGAISAVSTLLESTIGLIERLRKTYDDQKNSTQTLERHVVDIQGILKILDLVKHVPDLRTAEVLSEIENIRMIARKIIGSLEVMIPGEKGQARRFAHQLTRGTQEKEALAKLMERLDRAKSNLGLSLHLVNVGVTRFVGNSVAINKDILTRIDTLLRNTIGEDGGLKIADLIKNRPLEGTLIRLFWSKTNR